MKYIIKVKKNKQNKKDKEQIIENKIKELNYEINKFKEEKEKVIKIKKEYEKLHEKLIKDIEDLNIKRKDFEKFKEEEINKIKEEKEKLLIERKELDKMKFENQPMNIYKKNDQEIINNLENNVSEIKSIIHKKYNKDESNPQNNKIKEFNYIINSNKTINTNESTVKKSSHIKSFRHSKKVNNSKEESSKDIISNLSYSNINNKFLQTNFNNKSNSLININEYSQIDKIKKKYKKNNITGYKVNQNLILNTSSNVGTQKKNIKNIENKIQINKNKKLLNFQNKKTKKNIDLKNKLLKSKEDIKASNKFSKTSINFNKRKLLNKEKNNNSNLNINLSTDKIFEFEEELNKPLNPNEYDFIIPEKYLNNDYTLIKKENFEDKEIYIYSNNKKEIIFPSGLKKEIFDDGFQLIHFNNGDNKQIYKDGKTVYFYKESNTVRTYYPNGINVFKFNNGQIEKHFPNGLKKVYFTNNTIDYIFDEEKNENI